MLLMGQLTISMAKVEYLIGGLEHEWSIFHFIYGMSSFPLTNSIIFQRGRSTTSEKSSKHHFFLLKKVSLVGLKLAGDRHDQ